MKKILNTAALLCCCWFTAECQSGSYWMCNFGDHGRFKTIDALRAHVCAVHNYNCPSVTPVQTAPSPEELRRRREAKDLKEASEDANDKGVDCYERKDWKCAIRYFKEALDYDPENDDASYNLKKARAEADKEAAAIRTVVIQDKPVEKPRQEKNQTQETFFNSIHNDSAHYKNQLQKLMNDVSKIKVPMPKLKRKIHEGIILGLYNTNEVNAITDKNKSVLSAFTDKSYKPGEYFATSDKLSAKELLRGVVDNGSLGEYTLNSEYGKKLIEQLEGTQFNRLIAHSNGATVTEALIRKGVISVNELNIIGGDRSLINYFSLNELITSGKVKRIVVWVNPGDIIPYGTTAGLLAPTMAGHYTKTAQDYLLAKISGESKGGDAGVEYRYLKGPQYKGQDLKFGKDVFDAHGLEVYQYNMKQYFNTHK